ncbi:hypothetical protein U1Q18_034175 [Sarracenia purpurea var. burkii]
MGTFPNLLLLANRGCSVASNHLFLWNCKELGVPVPATTSWFFSGTEGIRVNLRLPRLMLSGSLVGNLCQLPITIFLSVAPNIPNILIPFSLIVIY